MGTPDDERRRERRLNVIIGLATIALIPIALYGFAELTKSSVEAAAFPDPPDCGEFAFDAGEWDDGPRSDDRAEQARGIVACNVLDGMGLAEAEALLGPPESVERMRREAKTWLFFEAGDGFDLGYESPEAPLALRIRLERGVVTGAGLDEFSYEDLGNVRD